MNSRLLSASLLRLKTDYGMLFVLLLLCVLFSYLTWDEQHPNGASGAKRLAPLIVEQFGKDARVLIAARDNQQDAAFAGVLQDRLTAEGIEVAAVVKGQPADARAALEAMAGAGQRLDVIAANDITARWAVFDNLDAKMPALGPVAVMMAPSYYFPNFLKADNLMNVADQIVVIAILAIGMTMVIITGGIDLSVGSLIALSAVLATLLIRDGAGGESASALGMVLCCAAGIGFCAVVGAFTGIMVTVFMVPPFIATLGMMLVASGFAYILAGGHSIYQVPASFIWLGRGTDLFGIPNGVVLMILLYSSAHIFMSRTAFGRHIYAVGGNSEAARLSGVPIRRVLLLVYTLCGALAGLGGIVTASQLKSGSPTYGLMYELYTIAAVVVGGTSLQGGEGKILGTLIGAFIIAVIQNGMNLIGVEAYTQKVVFGLVILGAVLLDMLKKQDWTFLKRRRAGGAS